MKNIAYVALAFLILTILFTFPSVLHLGNKIIGIGYDSNHMLGSQYIAKLQLENGTYPFGWTDYWRYPVGIDFSTSFDSILMIAIGLVLYTLSNNPFIVFNLSVIFVLFINGLITFACFKKISASDLLGIMGSIIYAYSFYLLARVSSHMNLIFVSCFPLFVYSIILLMEKRGAKQVYLVAISVAIIFLSSLVHFLIFVSAAIYLIPLIIVFYRGVFYRFLVILRQNIPHVLLSTLILVNIFVFFFSNDLTAIRNHSMITLPTSEVQFFSVDLRDYLNPSELAIYFKPPAKYTPPVNTIERMVFIGYLEIILFLLFLFSKVNIRFKAFISAGLLLTITLSSMCKTGMHTLCSIYNFYPFKGITEPGRFYLISYLFLTTGIVLGLKQLKFKTIPLILIIVLIILERIPKNFGLSETYLDEPFVKIVNNLESNAVLDLPVVTEVMGKSQGNYDLYSVLYRKPIVNGYIHRRGDGEIPRSFINELSLLSCGASSAIQSDDINSIVNLLNSNRIKTIVLHKDFDVFVEDQPNICNRAMLNIHKLIASSESSINKIYEDSKTAVYQIQ